MKTYLLAASVVLVTGAGAAYLDYWWAVHSLETIMLEEPDEAIDVPPPPEHERFGTKDGDVPFTMTIFEPDAEHWFVERLVVGGQRLP